MSMSKLSASLLTLLVAAVIIVGSVLLNAFVLTTLWSWFVVPTFGLQGLSMPVAFGLGVILNLHLAPHFARVAQSKKLDFLDVLSYPLGALLLGWLATLFM